MQSITIENEMKKDNNYDQYDQRINSADSEFNEPTRVNVKERNNY